MRHVWLACLLLAAGAHGEDYRSVSGIYPHLAMYNSEGECGTGAVVPWAGRLWVITYGPHRPKGSSDRLYTIADNLDRTVRAESVGGTHANRFIHRESQQLFIGLHAIDAGGQVRTINWQQMPGRLTGIARHLTDPAHKIYEATMEEGLYEVDVDTLAVKELIRDGNISDLTGLDLAPGVPQSKLPGYHGKGLYSGQGRLVYSNNGEHGASAQRDPTTISGALAAWTGSGDWQLVRRNQFTEIRGPGDLFGNPNPDTDPLWALGWDHRSLLLLLLDGGVWSTYRLPKGSHSYDGAHGWNTEWPRIRDIGEDDFLATMHGTFWRFPKSFCKQDSAGIAPRSNYLKVVGDFCRWNERIVLGCDDSAASEFLNKRPFKSEQGSPGQSNSNLWFIAPARLDQLGPVIGRGSVWLNDDVAAGTASDPYLFSGYDHRMLTLSHQSDAPVTFTIEIDRGGQEDWQKLTALTVQPGTPVFHVFGDQEAGAWVRLQNDRAATGVTAHFQYRNRDQRQTTEPAMFDHVTRANGEPQLGGIMRSLGRDKRTMGLEAIDRRDGRRIGYYELDEKLELKPTDDRVAESDVLASAPPAGVVEVDAGSVILVEDGQRYRIPANPSFHEPESSPVAEPVADDQPNLALGATVTVSSTNGAYEAKFATDGIVTDDSRWVSAQAGEKWLVVELPAEQTIASARIISGWAQNAGTMIGNAVLQVERDGRWIAIDGGGFRGNRSFERTVNFAQPVTARRVRLLSDDPGYVRIYELELYAKPRADVAPEADLTIARVCREVATERDVLNCQGTFYELPARNAGGLAKLRPIATHSLALHDFVSYRGMLVLTGLDETALKSPSEHIVVSEDGRCAVWCGVVDDLWQLGKPHGEGGPWKDAAVKAGEPSDPYLMTGYDRKSLRLSHAGPGTVKITVEVDVDGTGLWLPHQMFAVPAGETVRHTFAEGFSAYWVRFVADRDASATAWLSYD